MGREFSAGRIRGGMRRGWVVGGVYGVGGGVERVVQVDLSAVKTAAGSNLDGGELTGSQSSLSFAVKRVCLSKLWGKQLQLATEGAMRHRLRWAAALTGTYRTVLMGR